VADILHETQHVDHRSRDQRSRNHRSRGPREVGLGRPALLAVAFAFACIALAVPSHLAIVAIVPLLISVVAVLAAFRIMG